MGGFLRFVTRSPYHAIGVSVLSLLAPPFSVVAGAVIGLVTLRYGMSEGAVVLAGATAVFAVAMWGFAGSVAPAAVFVVLTALPAFALCALLRVTSSLGTVLAAATLVAGVLIAMLYLAVADPVAWWMEVLETFLATRADDIDPQAIEQVVELLAPVMAGLPIAVVVTSMIVVFLARWGHAVLDNPGGFGSEFRELRLGRRFAAGAGVVALIALFAAPSETGMGHDLLVLIVAAYVIQGIALMHGLVRLRGAARGWIIAMYASLLLMTPITVIVLSVAGYSDAWLDYRGRFGRSK